MTYSALNAIDVAAELGRSVDWLYRNWRTYVAERGFPPPLHDDGDLAWDPLQLRAWKDRRLPKELRRDVAELRKEISGEDPEVLAWQRHLNATFAGS